MGNGFAKAGRRAAWVTWLSLFLVLLIAGSAGLAARREVLDLMAWHLNLHGVDHNREIARRTLSSLRKLMAQGLSEAEVLERFRDRTRVAGAFGYAIFLIDRPAERVLAHSDHLFPAAYPRPDQLFRGPARLDGTGPADWSGALRAVDPRGKPILLYLTAVDARWTLGVESGMHETGAIEAALTQRLLVVVAAMAAAIAVLGFLVVRGLGRGYERALEREARTQMERLTAAQAEVVREARLAAVGQTACLLTHELRNPLAAMKLGLTDLAASRQLDDRQGRKLDLVLEQLERMDSMLSETLDMVRPVRPDAEPLALDALLDRVLDLLEPVLAGQALCIERATCPDCPPGRLDGRLMSQALINLLKNAVEASPRGGRIRIRLASRGDELILDLVNDGPVIPGEALARIFDAFVTSKSLGSGLGLPMAKRVIEEHGGRIWLTSSAAKGTRCRVCLPVAA